MNTNVDDYPRADVTKRNHSITMKLSPPAQRNHPATPTFYHMSQLSMLWKSPHADASDLYEGKLRKRRSTQNGILCAPKEKKNAIILHYHTNALYS
jgi:hypothetical protein